MFQSALLILPHSLQNCALGIPLWNRNIPVVFLAQDSAILYPQNSDPGLFSKILQHQWKLSMVVQASSANTVIRGAGAALMRSAEAEVLCVGGWFTRLFPGQWQNSFHFSPVQNLSQ